MQRYIKGKVISLVSYTCQSYQEKLSNSPVYSEDKNGQQRPLDRYMCQQYILNNVIGSPPEPMLQ